MRPSLQRQLGAAARRLLGRRNAVRLGRMLLDAGRLDVPNDLARNGEAAVQRTVLEHPGPDGRSVVVDAGANVGRWTRQLLSCAAAVGQERVVVHAFEPAADTYEALQGNLERWGLAGAVTIVRKGLSDRPGTAQLFLAHELAGSNSLHRNERGRTETIELTTVDAYCRDAGLGRVELLKCDLEGHDLVALEGARGMLASGSIEVVQFEYNFGWTGARRFLRDAFDLLAPLGYTLGKVTVLGIEVYDAWHPELETFREANFVAFRPAWRDRFRRVAWWHAPEPPRARAGSES